MFVRSRPMNRFSFEKFYCFGTQVCKKVGGETIYLLFHVQIVRDKKKCLVFAELISIG